MCHSQLPTRDSPMALPIPPTPLVQDFDGPGMVSRVDPILGMTLNGDDGDGDDINFSPASTLPAPYLHYGAEGDEGGGAGAGGRGADKQDKPKKPKAGGRERPRSAARRDDGESKSSRK